MPALAELQETLGRALRDGPTSALWPALWPMFREPENVAERRLAAYRRNVIGNWRSALASSYPVLAQLLGPRHFRELADRYIAAYPSNSGDLNAYGAEMAALLDASPSSKDWPYLSDMARLEWALLGAYGAADAPAFDFAALAAVPLDAQANLRLQVWAGAVLVVSPWPLADLWQVHQRAADERDAALPGIDLSSSGEAHNALVVRSEGRVFAVALNAGEAVFLRALQAKQRLAAAIALALAADACFNPGAVLQRLMALHVLSGFQDEMNG